MSTAEQLQALGAEIKRRRTEKGLTQEDIERLKGISQRTLSHIERGYFKKGQGFSIPSDELLEKLADVLDLPLSRMNMLLGRFPDQPFPFKGNDTLSVAERYDNLPEPAKRVVIAALDAAEKLAAELNAPEPIGPTSISHTNSKK